MVISPALSVKNIRSLLLIFYPYPYPYPFRLRILNLHA